MTFKVSVFVSDSQSKFDLFLIDCVQTLFIKSAYKVSLYTHINVIIIKKYFLK